MSTLMHLPDEDILVALRELHRVVRPGGLIEVGVWGADTDGVFVDDEGRYFRQRTDARVSELLGQVGALVAFETWDHLTGGGHYQVQSGDPGRGLMSPVQRPSVRVLPVSLADQVLLLRGRDPTRPDDTFWPAAGAQLPAAEAVVAALLIGHARVSTDGHDVIVQRDAVAALGVSPVGTYVDQGLTGTSQERPGARAGRKQPPSSSEVPCTVGHRPR